MNLGVQMPSTMSFPNSSSYSKGGDEISDQFPAGLRVLVVDDDPTCLMILEKMLRTCLYKVTKSNRAEKALSLLRENRNGYDIIISDVHMPDMDGFKLLEHVGLEMDLPVIMMSADDSKSVVMKGVTHGACDYLIKPVRLEALRNIWQHVVRKKTHEWRDFGQSGIIDEGEKQQKTSEDAGYSSSANEGNYGNSKRKKEEEDENDDKDDTSALKKPRVVWSVELHQQFMAAVEQLGVDKAVPKKILELMNVPGLTRENVASHLQKYRLYLRRVSGVSQHQVGLGNSFMGSMPSISGHDLQALVSTGHLPHQSLATLQASTLARSLPKSSISMPVLDQRNNSNIFSFANPAKFKFTNDNNSNNKQVNLLHGIPTNIRGMNMNIQPNNAHLSRASLPIVQQSNFSNNGVFNHMYNSVSQPISISSSTSQSNIIQGLDPNEAISRDSRGFDPTYDIFNDFAQHKATNNWDLQNVVVSFDSTPHVNVQPSVLVHQGVSNGQNNLQNRNGNGNGNVFFGDDSVRVKSESIPGISGQNTLFSDQFGQEDLLSALLKQQDGMEPTPNDFGFDAFPPLDNLPV